MGLFSWVSKHVFHPIAHVADDVASWAGDAGDWIAARWKPLTAALVAGVVFGVVFAVCPEFGPSLLMELAPRLLPALIAGLASGAAGQAARDAFAGMTPGTDLIVPALLGAALSAGGMVLGRIALAVPHVERTPIAARAIANLTGASTGEGAGAVAAGLRGKLGFIAVNVSPGPSDIVHIIRNDVDPAPLPMAPAREAAHGIAETLGRIGRTADRNDD
jgi:hypothetical protein